MSAELRKDAHLLEQVLEQLPAAVVVAEAPSGRVLLTNPQVSQILGFAWAPSQAIDSYNDYVEAWHADGRRVEAHEWPLARSLSTGERVQNEELQIRRGDGTRAWISLNSAPVRDEGGNVIAAVVTFLDVTARKNAERRAAEENRRTQLTLESIAEGFILLDEKWRIRYVNRQAERLLERTREELLEADIWGEFPELVTSKFLDEFNRARDEQVVAEFEAIWPATRRVLFVRAWPAVDGLGLAVYFQAR